MTSRGLALTTLALALAACAAPVDVDEDTGTTEDELAACGAARHARALAHYKNAVAWSKDRNANGACQSANGLQWSIADEASRAVTACSAFRTTIRTSPWAAPLRQALGPSLTLRSVTGELLVIKDSDWQNWTGAETFFAKGLSFWARAQGAYGPAVRIDFRANGKATWGELTHDEATGEISWRSIAATYVVEKSSGKSSGPRIVRVTREGKTDAFGLGVRNPAANADAPIFILTPLGTGSVLGEGATAPELYSLVSECDA